MCGRFTRLYSWRQLHALLDLRYPDDIQITPSWNVAPSQVTPICRLNAEGKRELVPMRWGFTPAWSKDGKPGPINARSESAATNGMFRAAYRARRCIVPTSGFYEWRAESGGKKPYYIHPITDAPMLMAGIWERWGAGPDASDSFAILTTAPDAFMAAIHDRMPILAEPEDVAAWLDPSAPNGPTLPASRTERLTMHPVSTRVNSPRNNAPDLCEAVSPNGGLFGGH